MAFTRLMAPLSRMLGSAPTPAGDRQHAADPVDAATPDQLIATVSSATSEPERANACAQLAQLIDAGVIDLARLRGAGVDADVLVAVAGSCSDAGLLPQTIAATGDQQQIAAWVVDGATSRIRQIAAQQVQDPAQLKALLAQVRGKDNGAYKILRRKHDALQAIEFHATQQKNALQAVFDSLERHANRVYDPAYAASFKFARDQWHSLQAEAPADLQERARQAIAGCEAVLAAQAQRVAEQLASAAERTARETARQAELAAAAARAAVEEEERRQLGVGEAEAAARKKAAEEQARAEQQAAETRSVRQITGLLAKANDALRSGDTVRAAGLHGAIAEKIGATPPPPNIARQVQQLAIKLDELKAWKDYAAAPKRAELIQEMEALIGSAEEPQALAQRIKQLQEDWKTVSKGIVSDSGADWQRFQHAATAAYQPCRDYFAKQSQRRQENLERRKAVLRRLDVFEQAQSGPDPDFAAIAAALREAPLEWRRHSPVDRAAAGPAQQELTAVLARLQARLDVWYDANIAAKQALIQRARALLDKEDSRDATDAAKQLQQLWKRVGTAPRDQEQRLWEDFRAQCDAVFQKRQHATVRRGAELEGNRLRTVALCEEVERIATSSGPPPPETAARIPEWRAAFEAIGELPGAEHRNLQRRFERAIESCQKTLARQRMRERDESFMHLIAAARHINGYGWATLQGLSAEERQAAQSAGEAFIAAPLRWPNGGTQAIQAAWQSAAAALQADMSANEMALRLLCVRAEIVSERPSPPEDQGLRREYQVKRLMQRMAHGDDSAAGDLNGLVFEWVRIGPVAPPLFESLLSRFVLCRDGIAPRPD